MENLIQQLIADGYLKTPAIINAFKKINRADFLISKDEEEAEVNAPLPIGYGQTISQPLTVAFMLELLQPQPGDKILDVGSGSGWQTALLAEIVGEEGRVYALEQIKELKKFGEDNVKKYNFANVEFFCTDGSQGLVKFAPFDKIIVAAAAEKISQNLLKQLKIGGRLVAPIGPSGLQDIVLMEKRDKNDYQEKHFPGFVFVPLIEEL